MNAKSRLKPVGIILTVVCILVVIGTCVVVIMIHRPKTLFKINPSEVISITLSNGDSKLTQITITERNQIEEIVNLVNNFTYTSSKKIPPKDGTGYFATLRTKSKNTSDWVGFGFWSDGVKLTDRNGEPGSSINYYGKAGYFDSLVTLADNATDPM